MGYKLDVLVACENSQVVTEQFIKLGHNAMSCDIAYDGMKGLPHYRGDIRDLLTTPRDLVIFHPDCTFITNTGVSWLHRKRDRWEQLYKACDFFNLRHKFNSPYVATENPIPHKYAVERIGMYSQLIQPYKFGHPERKATCLWLKGLPNLVDTNNVYQEMKALPKKISQRIHYMSPGPERARKRSVTFEGIAKAMAEQWGDFIIKEKQMTVSHIN